MQYKIFLTAFIHFFFGLSLFAQKATLTFSERIFDFGTIKATNGIVIHEFRFSNQGNGPLIIKDVKSSCGCTVVEWPKEPILPKKEGVIKASFDPRQQTGSVYKTIKITSNANAADLVIALKGVVIPTEIVEEVYKFTIGDLRLQTIYASFGEVYKGSTGKYSIDVFNNSYDKPLTLSFRKLPAHIKAKVTPEVIEPQQQGSIVLFYESSVVNSWDFSVDRLELLINGVAPVNNRIHVTANIKEDFSGLTAEELLKAAHVSYSHHEFDFGVIHANQTVTHSFIITNTGKSDLVIRKVSASCGCTAVQPMKTTIAPGDSTEIKAVFDARGRTGTQKKAITVITNDPKQARSLLWINAMVQ